MSTTAQAYGLIPVSHPSGQNRANLYTILNNAGTGYGTAIYKGDLVKVGTNGTIEIGGGAGVANLGVFAGCEYVDATGKPVTSPYWPASTALLSGSVVKAYVYDDQATTFKISTAGGTPSGYDQAVIGQQANFFDASTNNTSGSTYSGVSGGSIVTAAIAAGTLAQLRLMGYVNSEVYNATTNPYPEVLVQLVEVQFAPNAVGV